MDTLLTPTRRRLLGHLGALTALGTLGGLGGLAGCAPAGPGTARSLQRLSGQTMGTSYQVLLAGAALSPARLERLQADVQAALDAVDHGLSLYRSDSELVRFNRQPAGQPMRASAALVEVLTAAEQVSQRSGGAFDVTVAPLVMAWGFAPDVRAGSPGPLGNPSARLQPGLPAADRLQQGLAQTGHAALQLDASNRLASKLREGLQADLGGIAKGYGVDHATQVLLAQGLTDFMLEVGGEVRSAGHNAQGQPWQIGIQQPEPGPQRARLVLPLSGQALATSGDYRNFFEHAGRRYAHGIDPASGEPVANGLASVTVLADTCMQADAWTTALMVLGPARGYALAQQQGLAAHFILRSADGRLVDLASDSLLAQRGLAAG